MILSISRFDYCKKKKAAKVSGIQNGFMTAIIPRFRFRVSATQGIVHGLYDVEIRATVVGSGAGRFTYFTLSCGRISPLSCAYL